MELGNLVFGNSRGSFPIRNRAKWEPVLFDLFIKVGKLIGKYDFEYEKIWGKEYENVYGYEFENKVFSIFPYYWDDCTCGYDDLEDQWNDSHEHLSTCFHFKYVKLHTSLVEEGHILDKEYKKAMTELAQTNGLKDWSGIAAVCDCGYLEEWDKWAAKNNHSENCLLVKPNFLYKPTGFQIQWYKYALRDAYMNQSITLKEFQVIINNCKKSLIGGSK